MTDRTFPLHRVASLLFFSGACALIYQVAWFRELRLIFGASTAASAATLAVFMGGLGLGGRLLGKHADASENPLALYAKLEAWVAVTAAITPGLVRLAQLAYLGVGGAATLGDVGATVARLLLTAIVLGPSAIAMGGTLPAAARAATRAHDIGRQRVAVLYGINTFGAVTGTLSANFILIEVFGTRLTLWLACLLNALVAIVARALSRATTASASEGAAETAPASPSQESADDGPSSTLRWFPPLAAGISGLAFMLMELVWYRMLGPLLGGSSYTFGLILALALAGIGVGGLLYSRTRRPATMSLFAVTCALEAFTLALPYALGDKIAILTLLLRPFSQVSFVGAIFAWTFVASIVVLPAAIVSGYQFPVVIGLYGRGSKSVAKHVGNAYLANTIGSIIGSVGGGFGLIPLLSAPRCWQLVTALLLVSALLAAALDVKERRWSVGAIASAAIAVPVALMLAATGPTHAWRHSGIGAGRARLPNDVTKQNIEEFIQGTHSEILWEADGLESSVALGRQNGFTFIVNGKSDGSIIGDAGTQVMGGLLPALLHGDVKTAAVVGLGTGSTAGWLGLIPTLDRVDVVELEPAILRVARSCALANGAVMDNPKVTITLGDAREVLQTTKQRYDLIFSEPSNPYRAGISSLYTEEFYRSAAMRLNEGGLFAQWIQSYEVDPLAVATAAVTLRQVFPSIAIWETMRGDLVLVASQSTTPIDVERLRAQIRSEPFATAARSVWKTSSAEGVLARFVAGPGFIDMLAEQKLGVINTDDQNFLEFAFARNVGVRRMVAGELRLLATRLHFDRPDVVGAVDTSLLSEEKLSAQYLDRAGIEPGKSASRELATVARIYTHFQKDELAAAFNTWSVLRREPRTYLEGSLIANAAAHAGDDRAEALIPKEAGSAERSLLRGIWLARKKQLPEAIDALEQGFIAARKEPWVQHSAMIAALELSAQLGTKNPPVARRLALALEEPFAVESYRGPRVDSLVRLARAASDPSLCVRVIDGLGALPLNTNLYEARFVCYRDASDPRLPQAEEAFGRLVAVTRPFGADIPSPPNDKEPAADVEGSPTDFFSPDLPDAATLPPDAAFSDAEALGLDASTPAPSASPEGPAGTEP